MLQPVEEQKLEDPQVSGEPGMKGVGGPQLLGCQPHTTSLTMASSLPKPPSSEQKLDLQPEPTVTFLFTLLSTEEPTEPKDPEEDLELQEGRFLDKEDWGSWRTSEEISHLLNDCMRLRESLSITQADNLTLGKRLQNLVRIPFLCWNTIQKEVKAIQEGGLSIQKEAIQEGGRSIQEGAQAIQEGGQAIQKEAIQEGGRSIQEEA
ncbi:uncharacterized protein LOC118931586 [Manis pentadactyla]|uniref:uncharacterized protein LOC118931586 n=1 Tax=Manis pentadactyla TaxID=143292 RepID=UPI00255C68BB|nr:uncharacterized protein LOC118931586 [Manis pentadactyla]